jgi:hypothetical protein
MLDQFFLRYFAVATLVDFFEQILGCGICFGLVDS